MSVVTIESSQHFIPSDLHGSVGDPRMQFAVSYPVSVSVSLYGERDLHLAFSWNKPTAVDSGWRVVIVFSPRRLKFRTQIVTVL